MNQGFDPQQQLRRQMEQGRKQMQDQLRRNQEMAMWQQMQRQKGSAPPPVPRPRENCVVWLIKAPFRLVGWFAVQIFMLIRNLILIAIALAIMAGIGYLILTTLANS